MEKTVAETRAFVLVLLTSVLCSIMPIQTSAANENGSTLAASPADSLVLVNNRAAAATVVVSDNADSWTKMAAGWLVDYIERVSGVQLGVVPESKAPRGVLISVGHTKLAAKAGITAEGLNFDGCRMVVKENILYLLGRDVQPQHPSFVAIPKPNRQPWDYIPTITQGHQDPVKIGAKGTCRAVTRFLEEFCGIRWLVPTPKGVLVPRCRTITVPKNLDSEFVPWIMYHSNRLLYGDPRSEPAAYANNYRSAVKMYSRGGHSYPVWVPTEKYFKEHPEYFVLLNGKRTGIGNHLCASNQEVRQIILKAMQSLFDAGFDLVQLGQSDGYPPCECEQCRKLSNHTGACDEKGQLKIEHWGEPMLDLARWVAQECLEEYPGKYIHMLVYGPTREPSNRFDTFPANVVLEFASSASPELIENWAGKTTTGGTVYTPWHWTDYGIGIGMKMTYLEAADVMRYYKQNDITGIHSGGGQCWGLQGPTYYVFGRMMGDPDLDPRMLLKEYCDGLYGPASGEMMEFFERLHTLSDKNMILNSIYNSSDRFLLYYPPKRLKAMNALLSRAERVAETQDQQNWIRMTRDEFDYVQLVAHTLYYYRAYQIDENPDMLSKLRNKIEAFDQYRDRIVKYDGAYIADYFPGHGVLCNVLTRGQGGAEYGHDWREVRKNVNLDDLSGTAIGLGICSVDKPFSLDFTGPDLEATFHIRYTKSPPQADGMIDEQDWHKAPPVFMNGAIQTEVRALYDDENLYVAYICEDPDERGPQGVDIKRDNPICFMSVVELFVDPESTVESRRYYHFIVGATKNAIHDLREGFKSPGFQDTSWDAAGFHYGFHADVEKKQWCIEMVVPFKDLNTDAPENDQIWLGNMSRQHPGLHQWSKSGMWGFCDPRSFGRFHFQKPF